MRLDKYLQVSRLVKRRALAKQLCDGGHVLCDGRPARASTEVRAEMRVSIDYGWRTLHLRVLDVPARAVPKDAAAALYVVTEDERRPPEPEV